MIVIPVEFGSLLPKPGEDPFLTTIQRIESGNNGPGPSGFIHHSPVNAFCNLPVLHPLVALPPGLQLCSQLPVKAGEPFPHFEEMILLRGKLPLVKTFPELPDEFDLTGFQSCHGFLQFFQINDVAEQQVSLHQVFIHFIKIPEHHLPPVVEFIQRIRQIHTFFIYIIQGKQNLHGIRNPQQAQLVDEVVDCIDAGSPLNLLAVVGQVALQEESGTPVGQDDPDIPLIGGGNQMPGKCFKEWFHQ